MKKKLRTSVKQEQELKILRQIIETVSYNLDLREVLARIINIVAKVTKADSCFLYLLDDRELVLRASKNPHPKIIGKIKLKMGEGITGWVAQNQKSVMIRTYAFAVILSRRRRISRPGGLFCA